MTHATLDALEARKARLEQQLADTVAEIKDRRKNAASRLSMAYAKEILKLQATGQELPSPAELAKLLSKGMDEPAQELAAKAKASTRRSRPAKANEA
jgi:hypothetical protein